MLSPVIITVVLPVCFNDVPAAVKWIAWARELAADPAENPTPYPLVVFVAQAVPEDVRAILRGEIAGWETARLEVNPEHYEHPELGYGAMANQMFRAALEMTERLFPGQPTLWCEPDCIPTGPLWMEHITAEYLMGGKPFMGAYHANDTPCPHMTGNAVYPANWRELAPSITQLPLPKPEGQGWDSKCAHETGPQSHASYRIQQVWRMPSPRFTEANMSTVHPETALFHRCKNGSLIDVLAARRKAATPVAPRRPFSDEPDPSLLPPKIVPSYEAPQKPKGGTEIMIVSCRRDVDMLKYCLRSIRRFAACFDDVKVVVPEQDRRKFEFVAGMGMTLVGFQEEPGKGFLHHMLMKCRADEVCPDASTIVHVDSDCLFWESVTPDDYVGGGKCLMVREKYEWIAPRNPNRLIWGKCVERAVGITPEWENMVRHPSVFPRGLYGKVRRMVEEHTQQPFNDYVFSCQNEFPQSFAEFPTLGAVAIQEIPDQFHFVEYDHELDRKECGLAPDVGFQYLYRPARDKLVEGWSGHGLGHYKADWDQFLRGDLPKFYIK